MNGRNYVTFHCAVLFGLSLLPLPCTQTFSAPQMYSDTSVRRFYVTVQDLVSQPYFSCSQNNDRFAVIVLRCPSSSGVTEEHPVDPSMSLRLSHFPRTLANRWNTTLHVLPFKQEWCKSTVLFSRSYQRSNLLTSPPVMLREVRKPLEFQFTPKSTLFQSCVYFPCESWLNTWQWCCRYLYTPQSCLQHDLLPTWRSSAKIWWK
jgi:hypothetical protein